MLHIHPYIHPSIYLSKVIRPTIPFYSITRKYSIPFHTIQCDTIRFHLFVYLPYKVLLCCNASRISLCLMRSLYAYGRSSSSSSGYWMCKFVVLYSLREFTRFLNYSTLSVALVAAVWHQSVAYTVWRVWVLFSIDGTYVRFVRFGFNCRCCLIEIFINFSSAFFSAFFVFCCLFVCR